MGHAWKRTRRVRVSRHLTSIDSLGHERTRRACNARATKGQNVGWCSARGVATSGTSSIVSPSRPLPTDGDSCTAKDKVRRV